MKSFRALFLLSVATTALAATYDAVVVGAGLSGLNAAKTLAENNKTFVVLEARDRVGGRVVNHYLQTGGEVDMGAEFVGPTHDYVIALAKELGLELFDTYNKGDNVLYLDDKRSTYAASGLLGAIPPLDPISLIQIGILQGKVDDMVSKINVQAPWDSPNAAEYDSKTADEWLNEQDLTADARKILDVGLVEVLSADGTEYSLLYLLTYIAAAGNAQHKGTFERLTQTSPGAQQWRVEGGTGLLAEGLAKIIGADKIKLGMPVSSIVRGDGDNATYTTTSTSGETFESRHVIVAMSPPMADHIKFTPALTEDRKQVQSKMKMGSLGKGIAKYETPFWRDSGLTGQAVSDKYSTRATFDISPKNGSSGILMGFIQVAQMRELDNATDAEMTAKITEAFTAYFGDKAKNATEWTFSRWDPAPYSGGGPVAHAPVNVLYPHGKALRAPIGNLHFAGTESSDYWVGYMDGALRSGERVAKEID